jgi:hypothetical protein
MSIMSSWIASVRIALSICALIVAALPGRPAAAEPFDVDKFMGASRNAVILLKVTGRDSNGEGENYGTAFFVSRRGFALTAAHLFHSDRNHANPNSRLRNEVILGRIGSGGVGYTNFEFVGFHPDPERDLALIRVVDPPADTVFLKVCGSREPAATERLVAFAFTAAQQLRTLKGTRDGGLSGSRYSTSIPINRGDSGAPIVTETGRVFGMALSGVREQQMQGYNFFLPMQFANVLLADAQVKEDCGADVTELTPVGGAAQASARKTMIYVRSDESAPTSILTDVVEPLKEALSSSAKYVAPRADIVSREWDTVSQRIFDEEASIEDAEREIPGVLQRVAIKHMLATLRADELYVFVVYVKPAPLKLRSALLVIDRRSEQIAVKVFRRPERNLQLDLIGKEPDYLSEVAVQEMKGLLGQRPQLAFNHMVFADCFRWVPLKDEPAWLKDAAEELGVKLNEIWKGDAPVEHFRSVSVDVGRCYAGNAAKKRRLAPEHLSEIMINVEFTPDKARWRALTSWDDSRKYPSDGARSVVIDSARPMKEVTQSLAKDIEQSWKDLLKAARP